jgi:hypothetical protein
MVGYIVGYFEEWATDLNPMIIGYYSTWENAVEQVKRLERINIDFHNQLYTVYLVELEPDKTYIDNPGCLWTRGFDHYIVRTRCGKTFLYHNRQAISKKIDLPPPLTPESSQIEDSEWNNVVTRRITKKVKKPQHHRKAKTNDFNKR